MNILFVTSFGTLYGANKSLLSLLVHLKKSGQNVYLLSQQNGPLIAATRQHGITCKVIPYRIEVDKLKQHFLKGFLKYLINKSILFLNARYFKSLDVDLIHSNSSTIFFGAYLANYLGKPHVWHMREFLYNDYKLVYSLGEKHFIKWATKANKMIAISQSIYDQRCRNYKNAFVLYNGIISEKDTISKVDIKSKIFKYNSDLIFITVGFLSAEKNQLEAIIAFEEYLKKTRVSSDELHIIGEGDSAYEFKLKEYVRRNNLSDRIKFFGYIDDISSSYRNSDILLMCSRNEALGRVTIEAMTHGCLVVGHNSYGTAEIIKNEYSGFLYSDTNELVQQMIICKNDVNLRYTLILQAVIEVKRNFTIEAYTKKIEEIYKSAINGTES
ncbi:glycosyltransferase family 4 protein [Parapedobacter sp. DT-150]|uniref:glycosyltransferase family 4 protein n=1 Tax=Parapedobacter sp. DT-150 TaxID=3396162 RepID=UPI003F1E1FC5